MLPGVSGAGLPGVPAVMNQPVVLNSSENVEMERLRMMQEAGKLEREEAAFREQVLTLQKKLTSASLMATPADTLPVNFLTDYRAFLNVNAADVERSKKYYDLLKSTLNDLMPRNPYSTRQLANDTSNPSRAEAELVQLSEFPEDEMISRNIRAKIAAIRGGTHDDQQRMMEINKRLTAIDRRIRDLLFNIRVVLEIDPLTRTRRVGWEEKKAMYDDEKSKLELESTGLKAERDGLAPALVKAARELQFQQFIVELALQQRYIHALIAGGVYRMFSSNMAIKSEAYSSENSKQPSTTNPSTSMGTGFGALQIPHLQNIPALETFLMNRISDAQKDREAVENMMKTRRLSGAETVLRKMVLTAKYQPELQTLSFEDRQKILSFGEDIRKLSDALNTRNYADMAKLADEIEALSADPGMADIRTFSDEQPKKALFWVRQAKVALQVGDQRTMQYFVDAANRRAPVDKDVAKAVEDLQEDVIKGGKLADEMERLVNSGDYRKLFERVNEFAPLASSAAKPELKSKFDELVKKEESLRSTVKMCEEFEKRSSFPDAWISLSEIDSSLADDPRVGSWKTKVTRKCPNFIASYDKARENDLAGKSALALAWYLTALTEAPGTTKLVDRVTELGQQLMNH